MSEGSSVESGLGVDEVGRLFDDRLEMWRSLPIEAVAPGLVQFRSDLRFLESVPRRKRASAIVESERSRGKSEIAQISQVRRTHHSD